MGTNGEFVPRPYQEYLFKKALEENTILYLPTGAGKTFVAVLLIKELSEPLKKPLSEGGKRTIFAVNTVALVEQQKSFIQRHTSLTCEGYSGDSNVDIWSDRKWKDEIRKNQVLVITSQIFLDLLMHNVIGLSDVNLLIFDECHRAVGNHPMRQIMQMFKTCPQYWQPRVLALSASLLNCNVSAEKIYDTIRGLEITFQAKIQTVYSLSEVRDFCTNPEEVIKYYSAPEEGPILQKIQTIVDYAIYVLNNVDLLDGTSNTTSSFIFQPDTKSDKLRRIMLDVMETIKSMGFFGGNLAVNHRIEQIMNIIENTKSTEVISLLQMMNTQFFKIQNLMAREMQVECPIMEDRIYKYSTSKMLTLFKTLRDFYQEITMAREKFCCIIFVQRRYTAKVLSSVLNILSQADENYKFLKTDFIVGTNTDSFKRSREVLPQPKWNKQVIEKFKRGEINCIVATDVVDEGLDVPSCTLVVRYFAPMDFRAYIQSKGRARHKLSQFIILAEDKNDYVGRYENFVAAEISLREFLLGKERSKPSDNEIEATLYSTISEPYFVTDSTGGQSVVSANSSINLINMYCMSLKNSSEPPTWILIVAKECYQVNLTLPAASPLKETIAGDFMESIEDAKKSAALKACIILHKMGELNDKLIPVRMVMN